MAIPVFIGVDLSTYSLSATSTNASYPLSNLSDYETDTQWKSNSTAINQVLEVDMGSSVSADSVVLSGYNQPGDLGVYFQGSNNRTAWTNLTLLDGGSYYTYSASAYRYFRVYYNSIAALGEAPYMSNLFIGSRLTFTTPYDWKYKILNTQYQTSEKVALDGRIITSQVSEGRHGFELAFTSQNNSWLDSYKRFINVVRGKERPFYFVDPDSNVYYVHLADDYNPVTTRRYNVNDVTLKLTEHNALI